MNHVLDEELSGYIARLSVPQKKSLLAVIKSFLQKDNHNELDIIQYNKDIDEAMRRMDSGKLIHHEDIEREAAAL